VKLLHFGDRLQTLMPIIADGHFFLKYSVNASLLIYLPPPTICCLISPGLFGDPLEAMLGLQLGLWVLNTASNCLDNCGI
jgi:hypothetical protein